MFNIFGIEETIKNVYILSRKFITDKAVYNTRELKPFYLMFLRDHQPNQRILAESSISFVADDIGIWGKLNPFHDSNALLNDMHQESMVGEVYPIHEQEKHLQVIRLGYQYLTESCSPLKALFDLIIHTIFLRKTRKIGHHVSFGGSSSSSMGLIWISGHGDLDQENVAELLLHELTHHQLFIDERCHMHYNHAELSKPENFSTSAILNKRRPLDKVIHSIIVATEILLARNSFWSHKETKVHGTSKDLMARTVTAIKETMGMPNINRLLTERTRTMLEKALSCLTSIDVASLS